MAHLASPRTSPSRLQQPQGQGVHVPGARWGGPPPFQKLAGMSNAAGERGGGMARPMLGAGSVAEALMSPMLRREARCVAL